MPGPQEFGPLDHIVAEAIGQPGQRRFRLLVMTMEGDSASLWLEKEQLVALGEAIENVLRDQGYEYQARPLDDIPPPPVFPLNTTFEFRLAQLSMGVDGDRRAVVLIAADGPDDETETTTVTMRIGTAMSMPIKSTVSRSCEIRRPPVKRSTVR